MYYGGGAPRQRYSVEDRLMAPRRYVADERVIFERLWRGALYQALGSKAPPVRAIARKPCCCHCHCLDSTIEANPHHTAPLQCVPKKTMRSVVRYWLDFTTNPSKWEQFYYACRRLFYCIYYNASWTEGFIEFCNSRGLAGIRKPVVEVNR